MIYQKYLLYLISLYHLNGRKHGHLTVMSTSRFFTII